MMIVSRTAALAAAHQIPDVTSRAIEGPGSAGAMCCGEVRCVSSHERSLLTSTANTGVNGGTSERVTVRGEHHGMLPFTLTISERHADEINSMKGARMGNLEHPIDGALCDLSVLRREMVEEFRADDGVICAREQAIILRFDEGRERIMRARNLERAIALAVKQEGRVTEYTSRQFASAGLHIAPLEPEAA